MLFWPKGKTGKMDLGQEQLTHPSAAYLEYELVGSAAMTVTSNTFKSF